MNPLISIQILNWNRAEETQRAIRSALNQTYPNIEVVIVDNGSTDNSVSLTKKNFPDLRIIELDKNYGCPGGRNKGIEHCSGDFIFYLDNDGVLHRDAVSYAYRSIHSQPNIGIVTGAIYDFESPTEIDAECSIRNNVRYDNKLFNGGICLHDKKIYAKTGVYPDHFIYGAEESFLSLKLMENEFKIIKDESVILWHKQSDMARDRTKETLNKYFNNLYLAVTLFPIYNAIQFVLYFLIKYPMYAKRDGVFSVFLKELYVRFFKTIRKALKVRSPVSKRAYSKYRNFNPSKIIENN